MAKYHLRNSKEVFLWIEKIDIKKIVKEYLRYFPKNIKVEKILLFGSFAKGENRAGSDIDLVIVSPDLKNIDFLKRLELLSSFRKSEIIHSVSMDTIGYTPEEFADIDEESIVMRRAKKEGKTIYSSS